MSHESTTLSSSLLLEDSFFDEAIITKALEEDNFEFKELNSESEMLSIEKIQSKLKN